jgi:hypothetical protein
VRALRQESGYAFELPSGGAWTVRVTRTRTTCSPRGSYQTNNRRHIRLTTADY